MTNDSKILNTVNTEKSETSKESNMQQPTANFEIPRWKNGIIETIVGFKKSLSRSLSSLDPCEINQIESNYSEKKTTPRYFDEEWRTSCPRWSNALGEGNSKRKCRGGKCADFLRKLVDSGHVSFDYLDRFFYIYLGLWHDDILILRKVANTSNV